jgi:Amt family ammonium transporter
MTLKRFGWLAAVPALLAATAVRADDAPAPPAIDTGDTAWMLTSTAIVLMMTIPGLALFYGGMVRRKNVLATLMQSFATAAWSPCCGSSSATAWPSPRAAR